MNAYHREGVNVPYEKEQSPNSDFCDSHPHDFCLRDVDEITMRCPRKRVGSSKKILFRQYINPNSNREESSRSQLPD